MEPRAEADIFLEIEALCQSPGYIHALAQLSFMNNFIGYKGRISVKDMGRQYTPSHLIRTEIATLMGLMIKAQVDITHPGFEKLKEYMVRTESLLEEIHHAILKPMSEFFKQTDPEKIEESFKAGDVIREAIFYGGESAYNFQYRDMALLKYSKDKEWLLVNKGFEISDASKVIKAITSYHEKRLPEVMAQLKGKPIEEWTMLPGFVYSIGAIAELSGVSVTIVEKIFSAFTVRIGEGNNSFNSISDFNLVNAKPIIELGPDSFVSFHAYMLGEAIYDSPYYWMMLDLAYRPQLDEHRGWFTEEMCLQRFGRVFGTGNVYHDVKLMVGKDATLTDIDVLVIFGNRVIIVQAKSKKLTIEARKGNDNVIKKDFQGAIQNAYDQGYASAEALLNSEVKIVSPDGRKVEFSFGIKEIYIICVISENYPSLNFQSRQFLRFNKTDIIQNPLVFDVFALDAMTEMLSTPLYLLSYLNRRSNYSEALLVGHELIALSYHLRKNLWMDSKTNGIMLHDDIGIDLELAMMVRRDGVQGKDTPDGILTRIKNTGIGNIVKQIELSPNPGTLELGFFLLTMGEDAINSASRLIGRIMSMTKNDHRTHDFSTFSDKAKTGWTVHCTEKYDKEALEKLGGHCAMRKYLSKADSWHGVCLRPDSCMPLGGVHLEGSWTRDESMEETLRGYAPKRGLVFEGGRPVKYKVGRNEPCPCGSGKKYKRCCM